MAPNHVCWLDLETAGSDNRDPILEVAAILCLNDDEMTELGRYEAVCRTSMAHVDAMNEVVREMHEANGLLAECLSDRSRPLGFVDVQFDQWLRDVTGSKDHIALAGSGVGHFDRRMIAAQMPLAHKRFTYWTYDVGVVRRMLERIEPTWLHPMPEGGKAHRAMADAEDHRDEWLYYEGFIGNTVALRLEDTEGTGG